jgi:hypothetical protein
MNGKVISGVLAIVALCGASAAAAAAAGTAPVRADHARAVGKKIAKPARASADMQDSSDITRGGKIALGVAAVAAATTAVILISDNNSTD